jgi:ATP phosphoribosyltransferase regulatory subunit
MTAETAKRFQALEALATKLRNGFVEAGYEAVAPAILQPADIFLDFLGESVRGRTYVFSDLDGHELCLRPDFTVPVARLYLERFPKANEPARFSYNGPVFRYAPAHKRPVQAREFRQAGVELYNVADAELAETDVLRLIIDAVRKAGINDHRLKIGDLGLFTALVDAIDMPERWRVRLKHHFWRPDSFHDLLRNLTRGGDAIAPHAGDWPRLAGLKRREAEDAVAGHLDRRGIPLIGERTLGEITARLVELEADRNTEPLAAEKAELIEDYLAISGPPRAVLARLHDLADRARINLDPVLRKFERRLDLFKDRAVDCKLAEFSAEFGRDFEYYTGFVFQLEDGNMPEAGPLAGGGRYDRLLTALGSPRPVSAVGAGIHTERLLAAIEGVIL